MCEQITKDQHYVPRFYLKNFAKVIGQGKKEKALVSFYQFNTDAYKEDIPSKSICYKEYFYGKDGAVEKAFSQREGKWGGTIKDILSENFCCLNEQGEESIKDFSIYQYTRTLATYNFNKDSTKKVITTSLINSYGFSTTDRKDIEALVDSEIENDFGPANLIELCDELKGSIDDLRVSVIKFATSRSLITSDMPVVIFNPFCSDEVGIGSVGIIILFPISPHALVCIYDSKIYSNFKPFMLSNSEEDVLNLNKYQILNAENHIFALSVEDLREAISDIDLTLRKDIQAEKKVDTSYDGAGTFFAMHSRGIPYKFQLSFCTFLRELKKIPLDCRASLPRQYDREWWINLLFREFSGFKASEPLLKAHGLSSEEIKKRKKGFSKMRHFMEDYWEMTLQDRTITPSIMEKINGASLQYFPIDVDGC